MGSDRQVAVGSTPHTRSSLPWALLYSGFGVLCVAALYDTSAYHAGFAIPQAGVNFIHEVELAFSIWYALWGSLATLFFTLAIMRTAFADHALRFVTRLSAHPWVLVGASAFLTFCWAAVLHQVVLLGEPVADDECTYAFQAQTLLHGRIRNPVPEDAAFYSNKFVLLNERGWYGKYPIGHPLVLAVGEALGARWLVPPLLGLLTVLLTFGIGRKLFGTTRAALGAAILCASPQFVATHATQLSQTTSALVMLGGVWAMLRLQDDARLRWAALAGAAWGFALVTRPLPGAPFLAVAMATYLADAAHGSSSRSWATRVKEVLAVAPGVLIGAAILAYLNALQTGSPATSTYEVLHGGAGVTAVREGGQAASSFGGAMLRQNFWLFGWTFSLAFLPFARPQRARWLFWGLIAAEYSYRLIVPKTVVSSTGPIYVFEIVPLLALATADGAVRVAEWLARFEVPKARAWVLAAIVSASFVGLVAFVPTHARSLHGGAWMRHRVREALAQKGAERALVFANRLVEPDWMASWAYDPPLPSPDLDDEVLFVRFPMAAGGPLIAHDFWRRRFPDRRAFVYLDAPRQLVFEELRADDPPPPNASLGDVVRAQGGWSDPTGAAATPAPQRGAAPAGR